MIVPAIIPKTKDHLRSALEKCHEPITDIQIDLVDGKFAAPGNPSWPWSTRTFIDEMYMAFADIGDRFALEVDMMVEEPERFIEELVSANVSRIVIHPTSTEKLDDILVFRSHTKIGLAFTPDADLAPLHEHVADIDFVQCMGITEIGVQGNPFDARVLARITEIKTRYPHLEIAVDGGVTKATIPQLREAGATRLVSGSAIFGQGNPMRAYEELSALIHS
jgi:ribulose-phosphate 3-epimerase